MMDMLGPIEQLKLLQLDMAQDTAFDKSYVTEQLAAHEAAIRLFRFASANAKTPEVKDFAAKTLPTLRQHLSETVALLKKVYQPQ
jgi:putative membrane protein